MASVSSVSKQFRRMQQAANENIGLRNKTDELHNDIETLGNSVDGIKKAFQMTSSKVPSLYQGSGTTHEKRRNKLPIVSLANSMQECATRIHCEFDEIERIYPQTKGSVLSKTLDMCSNVQHTLATNQADYELGLEIQVVKPCNDLLERDVHLLEKSRKKLRNSRLDMDAARNKMMSMEKIQLQNPSPTNQSKLDGATFEFDESCTKFEQTQDEYACTLLIFLSKQTEHAGLYRCMMEKQLEYHRKSLESIESVMPYLNKNIDNFPVRPVFGTSLEEHLRVTNRKISVVLDECVTYLRAYNFLDTEGLLRKTGGTAKTKHLKASLDAGVGTCSYFSTHQADPHTIASLLKMYLRELPEPLLTYDFFDEWMKAAQVDKPADRQQALFNVLDQLPPANFTNFRFLVEFLSELKTFSEQNKMSASNIAIVVAPNILWPAGGESGANATHTSLASRIVESFIENFKQYFNTSNWSVTSPDTPVASNTLYAEVKKVRPAKSPPSSPSMAGLTNSNGDSFYNEEQSPVEPSSAYKPPIIIKPKVKTKPDRVPPSNPQAYRVPSPPQAQIYPASLNNTPGYQVAPSLAPVPLPRTSSSGIGKPTSQPHPTPNRAPPSNPQQPQVFQSKIHGKYVV